MRKTKLSHLYGLIPESENPTIDEIREIADLYLAGYLYARGVSLQKARRNVNKVYFVFRGENIENIIREYFSGVPVSPILYKAALSTLKTIIYSKELYQQGTLATFNDNQGKNKD